MKNLYPFQKELCDLVLEEQSKRIILQAPTGAGKTVMASYLIDFFLKQNKIVFVLVNRSVLIAQLKTYFTNVSILKSGFEEEFCESKPLQIIMLQSFYFSKRKLPEPNILVIDECHVGLEGKMMREFLNRFNFEKVIGLTATPITEKGYRLPFFEKIISKYQTRDLIKLGYLSRYRMLSLPMRNLELENVPISSSGDYVERELSSLMSRSDILLSVLTAVKKYIQEQKTLIFCVDVNHAEKVREELIKHSYSCDVIHSLRTEKQNEKAIEEFKKNKIQFLISVSMLTIGFDVPDVEALIICRPTRILRLALQIYGRGLRIAEGKKECLIIDCAKVYHRHGLPDEFRDWQALEVHNSIIESKPIVSHVCPLCDVEIIDFACPVCEKQFVKCNVCKKIFEKNFVENGICFSCVTREKEIRKDKKIKEEFELVEVKEILKKEKIRARFFENEADENFILFKKIVRQNPKTIHWKQGAENYRFGLFNELCRLNSVNYFRARKILEKALKNKYAPDWCLYAIEKNWRDYVD